MDEVNLKVGAIYRISPIFDPDVDFDDPSNQDQPARYCGKNAQGELLWEFLGIAGQSDWGVRWIGDEIKL